MKSFEDVIAQALELHERGLEVDAILEHFDPEDREEILGVFTAMNLVSEMKDELISDLPSKVVLQETIDQIGEQNVTAPAVSRLEPARNRYHFLSFFLNHKAAFSATLSLLLVIAIGGQYWYRSPLDHTLLHEIDREIQYLESDQDYAWPELEALENMPTDVLISDEEASPAEVSDTFVDDITNDIDDLLSEFSTEDLDDELSLTDFDFSLN